MSKAYLQHDSWKPRGIQELEPAAEQAVRSSANLVVIAGPGAGKTELLAQRASFLLETGDCPNPRRILAISFKRDAATNLGERVRSRCGSDLGRRFDSQTFDAFGKSLLDQFAAVLPSRLRPTATYDVVLKSIRQEDVAEVLAGLMPPSQFGSSSDLGQFHTKSFYDNAVLFAKLDGEPKDLRQWAAEMFWQAALHNGTRSWLTFPMICRLAIQTVMADPVVKRAFRATYSHVFLDEFQDTTKLQYILTCRLFSGAHSVLTAVGDPQQRIMGWAGALDGIFSKFETDFSADTLQLERNRRASTIIAPVVAYLAARLRERLGHADATEVDALACAGPPPDACGGYLFSDSEKESTWIAQEIAGLIASGISPRAICVLVRMKAKQYAQPLIAALSKKGIRARIEEETQSLLAEPASALTLLALRSLFGLRPGTDWLRLRDQLSMLLGIDTSDSDEVARLEARLGTARALARKAIPVPPTEATRYRGLLGEYVEPLCGTALRCRYAQYQRGTFYETLLDQLSGFLAEASRLGTNSGWDDVLDAVEGRDALPILTIHKSKGLEYEAVFFLGLEDSAFWSFRKTPDEELNAFFVAVSRAKQRVAFTFVQSRLLDGRSARQSRTGLSALYELLNDAGIQLLDSTTLHQ